MSTHNFHYKNLFHNVRIVQDTKLDVLNILANVAGGSKKSIAEVRVALGGISEWFDEYIATEEADPGEVRNVLLNY